MSYNVKILLDSISETGKRLTTFEITFPRIVLAEAKTHRVFKKNGAIEEYYFDGLGINDDENLSRNSASSRAIPFSKQLDRVNENPFIPEVFPINCKGMQPQKYVSSETDKKLYNHLVSLWLRARDDAVENALHLYIGIDNYFHLGNTKSHEGMENVHKQLVNRLLEPFMWHTCIITATEFDNFFKLRTNENAQYEIRRIADLMYSLYHFEHQHFCASSVGSNCDCERPYQTQKLKVGEWHLPLIHEEDFQLIKDWINNEVSKKGTILDNLKKISVARCARVSYLTHEGKRDIEKDLELFERLRTSGHWSPFEHVATPYFINSKFVLVNSLIASKESFEGLSWSKDENFFDLRSGNFIGWRQMRKELPNENCTYFRKGRNSEL